MKEQIKEQQFDCKREQTALECENILHEQEELKQLNQNLQT